MKETNVSACYKRRCSFSYVNILQNNYPLMTTFKKKSILFLLQRASSFITKMIWQTLQTINDGALEANVPAGVCHRIWTLLHFFHKGSYRSKFFLLPLGVSCWIEPCWGSTTGSLCSSTWGRTCSSTWGWTWVLEGKVLAREEENLMGLSVFTWCPSLEEAPDFPYLLCMNWARIFAFWISSADSGRPWLAVNDLATGRLLPADFWPGCSTRRTFLRSLVSITS